MAQNNNSTTSSETCKKFFKKFSFSTTSRPNPQIQTKPDHKSKNATFRMSKTPSSRDEAHGVDSSHPDYSAGREAIVVSGQACNDQRDANAKDEGKFSDYIRKIKDKMRTGSNVGVKKSATMRRDSFNDRVSCYINRAKVKITRTTTNVGNHKDGSFK